jgi:signal transduction histidine kinase
MIERMKDELISVVSHELRTPLTSIRGSLGLLAGGLLRNAPDKAQRMLDIAVDNTDRLIRLINDFLDLERLQSGQVELRPQPSLASELVLKATDEMRAMAQTAAVELRPHADATALSVDPDRVVQVLTNLLSNAIKFSPAGGVVEVSAQAQGGMVLFAVEDHGRGIPADKLETIFGRFQQVDPSDARRGSGTGLGLAICRSIVDQHGGRLWAESVEGQGSTFKVLLPARFVARPRTSVAA